MYISIIDEKNIDRLYKKETINLSELIEIWKTEYKKRNKLFLTGNLSSLLKIQNKKDFIFFKNNVVIKSVIAGIIDDNVCLDQVNKITYLNFNELGVADEGYKRLKVILD